jgi:hypothetical protein
MVIVSAAADQDSAARDQLHIVINWFDELKRLVPTK